MQTTLYDFVLLILIVAQVPERLKPLPYTFQKRIYQQKTSDFAVSDIRRNCDLYQVSRIRQIP